MAEESVWASEGTVNISDLKRSYWDRDIFLSYYCHIFSSLIKLEFGGGVYGAKCQSTQAYLQYTYLYCR